MPGVHRSKNGKVVTGNCDSQTTPMIPPQPRSHNDHQKGELPESKEGCLAETWCGNIHKQTCCHSSLSKNQWKRRCPELTTTVSEQDSVVNIYKTKPPADVSVKFRSELSTIMITPQGTQVSKVCVRIK